VHDLHPGKPRLSLIHVPSFRRPLGLLLVAAAAACSDSSGPDDADRIVRVQVTPDSVTVDLDAGTRLSASAFNGRGDLVAADFTWSSNAPGIASVSDSGQVSGVGEGAAAITASTGSVRGSGVVIVRDPYPPAAPSDIAVQPLSNTEIEVVWRDQSHNEDEFVVLRAPWNEGDAASGGPVGQAGAFIEAGRVGADLTRFVDPELEPEAAWVYLVQACNENGCTAVETPDTDAVGRTHPTLSIDTSQLPDGTMGVAYGLTLQASGPEQAPSWSVVSGDLPPGLELASDGRLAGTPTEPGSWTFAVEAAAAGQAPQAEFTLAVGEEILPPLVRTTALPMAGVGAAFEAQFVADLGDGAYEWALTDGASLPAGLELESRTGTLSGRPEVAGSFELPVEVRSAGFTGTGRVTLEIAEALTIGPEGLASGVIGVSYEQLFTLEGGHENVLELAEGGLPAGLELDLVARRITGTPEAVGAGVPFVLRASNALGQHALGEFVIDVFEPLALVTTELPDGAVDLPYEAQLAATGGDESYTFTAQESGEGALPGGLTLDAEGHLSGAPSLAGDFTVAVELRSDDGQSVTTDLSLRVEPSDVVITTSSLPEGTVGTEYRERIRVEGGDGRGYDFAVSAGTLPAGVTLGDRSGELRGTPTEPATSDFEVTVGSGDSAPAVAAFRLTVVEGAVEPLVIETSELDPGRATIDYDQSIVVSGGAAPHTFRIVSGALPAGLSLDSDGRIAGTPSAVGSASLQVQVEDARGTTASQSFTLAICEAPLSLAPGEHHVTPFVNDCGIVLGGDAAEYRIGLIARALTSSSPVAITGGVRLATAVGESGTDFFAPPALAGGAQPRRSGPDITPGIPDDIAALAARTEALHRRLNEQDLALQRERGGHPNPAATRLLPEPEGPAAAPLAADPPEQAMYWVYDETTGERVQYSFNRRGLTASAVYYEMQGMPAGEQVSQARIDGLLAYHETWGVPIIEQAFGGLAPSGMTTNFTVSRPVDDLDQNGGRIVILQIPDAIMLSGAAAYVSSCDRYPRSENRASGYYCTGSNEGEVTYFAAPDSDFYLGTLVHEVKHISSHGWALYSSRGYNPSWVEEGTAEIAKEKSSRDASGLADGVEARYADLYPGGSRTSESYGMATVYGRASRYLYWSPDAALVGNPTGSNSTYYGASWLFHRFITDGWAGGDEDAFHTALNTGGTDVGRIEAVTGESIEDLLTAFTVAIGAEGTAAESSLGRSFGSYDFVGISQGVNSSYGTWPFTWGDETFTSREWTFSDAYRQAPFFIDLSTTGSAVRLDVTRTSGSPSSASDDGVLVIQRR
jgi:hypothetical protein